MNSYAPVIVISIDFESKISEVFADAMAMSFAMIAV